MKIYPGAGDGDRTRDLELGKHAEHFRTLPDLFRARAKRDIETSGSVRNCPSAVRMDTRWTPERKHIKDIPDFFR